MGSPQDDRFRRLVHEHSPAIGNYLRRRLYPLTLADLDDLVEETLLVVWRRIDSVPDEAELPWMIGVARNVLRNSRRSQYRRTNFESTLRAAPDEPSAEDLVIADVSVRDALKSLNDDDRRGGATFPSPGPFSRAFCGGSSHLKVSGASRHELGMQAEELS